jgi:GT2 family glycosyltransferase
VNRVTAVVVNWNSGDDLARVVADLALQSNVEVSIVVVDNDSSDASIDKARATGVAFELVAAGANLGYTGGNALGAEHAGADADIFVVNPDVSLPDRDTLAVLCDALTTNPTVGAVAPVILLEDGLAEYLDSVIDLDRAVAEHTNTSVPPPPPGDPVAISWIDGAAWLIRAEARRTIGLFDPRFFLFWEEVDWCLRARAAGWTVALHPGARVEHRRSSSFRGTRKGAYYYWRNLYLVCKDHAPSWRWRVGYTRRLFRFALRPVILRSGYAAVVMRGAFDGIRGRSGPGPEDAR